MQAIPEHNGRGGHHREKFDQGAQGKEIVQQAGKEDQRGSREQLPRYEPVSGYGAIRSGRPDQRDHVSGGDSDSTHPRYGMGVWLPMPRPVKDFIGAENIANNGCKNESD